MTNDDPKMPPDAASMITPNGAVAPPIDGKARLLTLEGVDRRTAAYRDTKRLIGDIESDLGGADHLAATQRQLVQHGAVLGAVLTDMAAKWLRGGHLNLAAYCTTIN